MTSAKVDFGLTLPSIGLSGEVTPEPFAALAENAERLGFTSIWATDRVIHPTVPSMDPLELLAFVISHTSRARLGTSVVVSPLRNPVMLAKSLSTLDRLSSGRAIFGMAIGSREADYNAAGVPFRRRATLFMEGFKLMLRLWSGEPVTYSNEFWRLEGARMLPGPVQNPHPPILFGGSSEAALKRAGTHADGWIAGSHISPSSYAASWRKVLVFADSAGRKATRLRPAKIFYIQVDRNKSAARRMASRKLTGYYGSFDVENVVLGTSEECRSRLAQYVEAGARSLILTPVDPSVEQLEAIADTVLRRL